MIRSAHIQTVIGYLLSGHLRKLIPRAFGKNVYSQRRGFYFWPQTAYTVWISSVFFTIYISRSSALSERIISFSLPHLTPLIVFVFFITTNSHPSLFYKVNCKARFCVAKQSKHLGMPIA